MPLALFVFLAVVAVVAALGVVVQRNPVHCLLSLVLTLLVIAVLFIGLGATTVGFLQAIVYAGAIMVLFLFVIWLLNLQVEPVESRRLALKLAGSVGAAALIAELVAFFVHTPTALPGAGVAAQDYGSITRLAATLFSNYLIAFEITSILLLAAVVGAVALASRMTPTAAEKR
jgi:NADH-quinone oxidoreductase subunit J